MTDTRDIVLALHCQNDVLHADGKIRVGLNADDPRRPRVIAAAQQLIAAARANGALIVWVRIAFAPDFSDVIQNCPIFRNVVKIGACVEGSWGAGFHQGFEPQPGDVQIIHKRINAFQGTDLEATLARHRVKRVIVLGVATNSVVEHSARHASDLGYDTWVASDACATSEAALHDASLRNLAYVATVANNASILGEAYV